VAVDGVRAVQRALLGQAGVVVDLVGVLAALDVEEVVGALRAVGEGRRGGDRHEREGGEGEEGAARGHANEDWFALHACNRRRRFFWAGAGSRRRGASLFSRCAARFAAPGSSPLAHGIVLAAAPRSGGVVKDIPLWPLRVDASGGLGYPGKA